MKQVGTHIQVINFEDLGGGDIFFKNKGPYLKTEQGPYAVHLEHGGLEWFGINKSDPVLEVRIQTQIEDDALKLDKKAEVKDNKIQGVRAGQCVVIDDDLYIVSIASNSSSTKDLYRLEDGSRTSVKSLKDGEYICGDGEWVMKYFPHT